MRTRGTLSLLNLTNSLFCTSWLTLGIYSPAPSKSDDAERERKKRIDAIWAEMNTPSSAEKSAKQPLDDISSAMNRPSTVANQQDPKLANKMYAAVCIDLITRTFPSNLDLSFVYSPTPTSSEASSPTDSTSSATTQAKKPAIARPKSNLSALVSQYNIKTPKMNTLDKSKLDWQGYVEREGIREDLKYRNKDGWVACLCNTDSILYLGTNLVCVHGNSYMEKVAFLQRVDDRRLQDLKAGQRSASKKKWFQLVWTYVQSPQPHQCIMYPPPPFL